MFALYLIREYILLRTGDYETTTGKRRPKRTPSHTRPLLLSMCGCECCLIYSSLVGPILLLVAADPRAQKQFLTRLATSPDGNENKQRAPTAPKAQDGSRCIQHAYGGFYFVCVMTLYSESCLLNGTILGCNFCFAPSLWKKQHGTGRGGTTSYTQACTAERFCACRGHKQSRNRHTKYTVRRELQHALGSFRRENTWGASAGESARALQIEMSIRGHTARPHP